MEERGAMDFAFGGATYKTVGWPAGCRCNAPDLLEAKKIVNEIYFFGFK
jgi:hypothetical protein